MRYASIDLGSNTVLLLIAELSEAPSSAQKIKALVDEARVTRLSEGLSRTGVLSEQPMRRTLEALREFSDLCKRYRVDRLVCVATEAVRRARNSSDFLHAVQSQAGFLPEVISGEKEAQLAYLSVRDDFACYKMPLLVLDIGGASTELIWDLDFLSNSNQKNPKTRAASAKPFSQRLQAISMPIGSVKLTEIYCRNDPLLPDELDQMRREVQKTIRIHLQASTLPTHHKNSQSALKLVGLAATVTSLSMLDQHLVCYDASRIRGSTLTKTKITSLIESMAQRTLEQRQKMVGIDPKRADVLVAGAVILEQVLEALAVSEVTVSDRGIRYGKILDELGRLCMLSGSNLEIRMPESNR